MIGWIIVLAVLSSVLAAFGVIIPHSILRLPVIIVAMILAIMLGSFLVLEHYNL